jgi:triacylglycerol lipase
MDVNFIAATPGPNAIAGISTLPQSAQTYYSQRMANAWIQRLITLGVPLLWWTLGYNLRLSHPIGAVVCFIAPIFVAPVLEALQFAALYYVNRSDPAPRASGADHVRAWWGELCATVLVFNWWQPFRRAAVADNLTAAHGQRGVVLVHGFFCNRGFWTHWSRRLRRDGRVFVAVDLAPAFGSIDDYVAIIDHAVHQVRNATGLPPVLVGHSMGGLAIRAWLAQIRTIGPGDADGAVHRVITLGTPHHGTWLGNFSHTVNGSQMQLKSRWLEALEKIEKTRISAKYVCFFSNCDNIVFPVSSATLEGADNRLVRFVGHVDMAHDPAVIKTCWELMR